MQQKDLAIWGSEEDLVQLVDQLGRVLQENRISGNLLKIQRNKGTVSIFLRSDLIFRLTMKGKGFCGLSVSRHFAELLGAGAAEGKAKGEMLYFEFEPHRTMQDWAGTLCRICQRCIEEIPKQFDCCDRYEECSQAGQCTNPDWEYAMECGYKKQLRMGRIFYGSHRNIEEENEPKREL